MDDAHATPPQPVDAGPASQPAPIRKTWETPVARAVAVPVATAATFTGFNFDGASFCSS